MWKKLLSLVLLISFLSFNFCFAFDLNTAKQEWMPKITQCWNNALTWVNNDFEPWVQKHIGDKSVTEFKRELTEAIKDVPVTIHEIWTGIIGLFHNEQSN